MIEALITSLPMESSYAIYFQRNNISSFEKGVIPPKSLLLFETELNTTQIFDGNGNTIASTPTEYLVIKGHRRVKELAIPSE